MSEGVSKSKESSHTYVEGHVLGESKYGFTVSTDCNALAAASVFRDVSPDKMASNT